MKHSLFVLLFLVAIIANIAVVQGATYIEPYSPQPGPTDNQGTDKIISFYELSTWVQIAWISSVLLGILGAIKFWPFILGKVKVILQNKNRGEILEYLRAHPGCTIADLSKNTGINRGSVKYHLSVLLIERKIVRKKEGKLMYLFMNGGTDPEKKRMYGYIMSHPKQEILKIIQDEPGIGNKDIAERLGLDRSTVHWHLSQFLDEKMVVSQWDGRNLNYSLTQEVDEILKKYRL
jgi:predicted transcriptional regulator